MRRRKTSGGILTLLIIVLVIVFLYSGLRILESTVFYKEEKAQSVPSKTITVDGVDYFPRQDLEIYLLMGIDRFGPVQASNSYNNDGEADTLIVLAFDKTNETIQIVSINRDSMVKMPVLGIGGKQAGTFFGQIALAHTYGSGLEDSCENTVRTVSDLLYGIPIDHYVSMNMDGIALINDAVGGVTVTVVDDFSAVDETIPLGEVTLRGEQATSFIRMRKGVGDQLNLSRMERQKEYVTRFADALRTKMESSAQFSLDLYDTIAPYIVTDCSGTVLSAAMERYADFDLQEIVSLQGENRIGDEFMEYHLDEEALTDLVLKLFFVKK